MKNNTDDVLLKIKKLEEDYFDVDKKYPVKILQGFKINMDEIVIGLNEKEKIDHKYKILLKEYFNLENISHPLFMVIYSDVYKMLESDKKILLLNIFLKCWKFLKILKYK